MQTARRTDSSLLVKPPVIAGWLFLCVLATVYGKTTIGFLLGFVFLLTLCSYLWAKTSLKNVGFELNADRSGLFPGQSFWVTRTVRNRKSLPMLWVEIRESCAAADPAAPKADVIVAEDVFVDSETGTMTIYERLYTLAVVRWRGSVFFKDEWLAHRRGIMEINASLLRSGDGFGLCAEEMRFTFPSSKRIVVYPSLTQASAHEILNDMWDTRSNADGFLKDRMIIKSVRDYQPGDAVRDVNMRLLARGQALQTNVFETVKPDTVLFVLDAGSFRDSDADVFERSLSVAASLIHALVNSGIHTALMAPKSLWFDETCTYPSVQDTDRYRMFELLAAASQHDADFTTEITLPEDEPGRIYILCADTGRLTFPAESFFPEYKTLYLAAEENSAGDRTKRVRSLFDFGRAGF